MSEYKMSSLGDSTVSILEKQGLLLPPQPQNQVVLPSDITELSGEDLLNLMAEFTAWGDYAEAQLGLASIAEQEASRVLDVAEAKVWTELPPKTAVSTSKYHAALDPDVQKAKYDLDVASAYKRMVFELAAGYLRDANLLSRELSRRTSEYGTRAARKDKYVR